MTKEKLWMRIKCILCSLALLFSLFAPQAFAEAGTPDLSTLTRKELDAFLDDIDAEKELHHETEYETRDAVLAATKNEVEAHFAKQDIEISWAWIDYSYTRDWDFYTLSTHIDYRDASNKKQKPDVYSEVFLQNGQYTVYYLLVGTELVINRRDELPDTHWAEEPKGVVNERTGTDLSKMSVDELNALKTAVNNEIKANHSTNSTTNNLILSMTKSEVEQYFFQQNISVSWAWFDYSYTCDWSFYSLKTPIDCRDAEGHYTDATVYSEAYPFSGQYALCYLAVDDTVLINRRDELPENLAAALLQESETVAPPAATAAPTATTMATEEPLPTVEPLPTEELILLEKGASGDQVLRLQQRLIALGYLKDSATGEYDTKTAAFVKAFQAVNGLECTGVIRNADMKALDAAMEKQAKRAVVVAMTNYSATDVFMPDGNTYDSSKFHSYADIGNFFLTVYEEGTWTYDGESAWSVNGMVLQIEGVDSYMKITCTVTFDGVNYVVSNVTRKGAMLRYLNSNDPSKIGIDTMEPSETTPYLTVPPELLREDRNEAELTARREEKKKHDDWVSSQFSIWDGAHKELEKLIKKSLNDEKSYKHIETTYVEITDAERADSINQILNEAGVTQRVEIGDLFIMTQFSAKNVFNATVKNTAYGIASYKANTITLVSIE